MIGWYVHHHGHGHRTRLLAVLPHLEGPVTVLSSLERPADLPAHATWVRLGRDDLNEGGGDPAAADPTAGGALHWAPLAHAGHSQRLATIASLLPTFDVMVVDVSVEVTVLARLLGRPVVRFTQPGDRTDAPHALGDRLATATIAPWPADEGHVDERPTTEHVGGISRFASRGSASPVQPGTVLALGGGAHDEAWNVAIDHARATTPEWSWTVVGPDRWDDDPWSSLCGAEVVVSAAGQNAIADVAAARARAVVAPRPRPFDEQLRTAEALRRRSLAVVVDLDDAVDWPETLERARRLDPDWRQWRVDGAAERAAAVIERARWRA